MKILNVSRQCCTALHTLLMMTAESMLSKRLDTAMKEYNFDFIFPPINLLFRPKYKCLHILILLMLKISGGKCPCFLVAGLVYSKCFFSLVLQKLVFDKNGARIFRVQKLFWGKFGVKSELL